MKHIKTPLRAFMVNLIKASIANGHQVPEKILKEYGITKSKTN